jgi:L-aspartate oxidase
MREMQKTRTDHVSLNLADFYQGKIPIHERFPGIYEECKKHGIDIEREPIPVVPAAHFFCGGIAVDLNGESELPGLFAAGEVACTGVHGSNRLASTSLLEALTWGVASADEIHRQMPQAIKDTVLKKAFDLVEDWQSFGSKRADPNQTEREKNQIRKIMWEKVGILRTKKGLFEAKNKLRILWNSIEKKYAESALSEDLIELRHMAETAWIITNSASSHTSLMKDSLGGHVVVR